MLLAFASDRPRLSRLNASSAAMPGFILALGSNVVSNGPSKGTGNEASEFLSRRSANEKRERRHREQGAYVEEKDAKIMFPNWSFLTFHHRRTA